MPTARLKGMAAFPLRLVVFVLAYPTLATAQQPAAGRAALTSFTDGYCTACHNAKVTSGSLDLQRLTSATNFAEGRDTWDKVVQRLKAGEMPPPGAPKPERASVERVTSWLEDQIERADRNQKPNPGVVVARRLNRTEYNNTVRDLLGVNLRPADSFPPDDTGYGFDNVGAVLSMSPALTERYLAAAEQVARAAVFGVSAPAPAMVKHEPWYVDFSTSREVRFEYDKTGMSLPSALHVMHRTEVDGDYDIAGLLRGTRPDGSEPLQVAFWVDGQKVQVLEYPVPPGGEESGVRRQFRVHLTPGEHWLSASFLSVYEGLPPAYKGPNPSRRPQPQPRRRSGVAPTNVEGAELVPGSVGQSPVIGGLPRQATTAFFVSNLEVTGPFNATPGPTPESVRRIFVCGHTSGRHGASCARRIVTNLGRRAYRRPLAAAEVNELAGFVSLAQKQGDTFEEGLVLAIQKMLISPNFLFRIEQPVRSTAETAPISQHELASRLSYFLWSSMPDDELLSVADRGELRNPQTLHAQVRRMVADPRAKALAENFGGQWLQFRALESHEPDRKKFQDYTEYTRLSLQKETELFVDHVFRQDRSILDFLNARYTFANQRLAEFYGIPGVTGHEFRKVELGDVPRAGIITHASVLTASSYANRTSPVLRGKWILENILNSAPPPPPPDVPNIDESAVGLTGSLRQQMEQHRSNTACASCHSRMDPLGFGLENFNAIGQWRDKDGKFEIDASGVLPDGRKFRGPVELAGVLRSDARVFTAALTERLLTYALGRGIESGDRPALRMIADAVAAKDYKSSALIWEIVNSAPFRQRRKEVPKT